MKPRSVRISRLSILAAGIAAIIAADAQGAALTSNLALPEDGIETISKTRWLASEFTTDGDSYLIDSITLRLQQNVKGVVVAALYSDAGGRPGELLMTLNPTGAIGASTSSVTFRGGNGSRGFDITLRSDEIARAYGLRIDAQRLFGGPTRVRVTGERPEGLGLDANSTYWIVTRALSGQFASGYTDVEQGEGVGYSPNWAVSENSGATWDTRQFSPLFLEILADPADLLVTDQEAITSAIFSGLPMALAQREAVFNAVRNVTRDVNARLFRLRSESPLDSVAEGKKTVVPEESRWEVFAAASYGSADHETFLPAAGFQTDTWAETIGVEYRVNERFTIGAAFTYVQSNNALALDVGDADLEGEALAAYVSYQAGGFYADALYSFSTFEHDLQRDTFFGHTATAEPNSRAHTLQLNFGYNLPVAGFVTGPYASIDWMIGELESYEEANGTTSLGTARLRVPGQTFDSLISRIGWQISTTFAIESVKVTPQLRAAWAHEYRDELEFVDVELARSPYSMRNADDLIPVGRFGTSAETQAPGSDAFELGVGFGIEWDERYRIFLDYTARLFQNHAIGHQVSLTGELRF